MRETVALLMTLAVFGCGGDSSGPSNVSFAGTYPGQFYLISTSTVPAARTSQRGSGDAITGFDGRENYPFSVTAATGDRQPRSA